MDFGKLPDISKVDFTLPPEDPANAAILGGKPVAEPHIYIGCPSWNHPEWMGKVYAKGPKSREFLPEYVQQFSGIEVNATAYNMPGEDKVKLWKNTAPSGFKYCVKFPQTVTHYGAPSGKLAIAKEFAKRMQLLGDKAGPPLLQFSERFGPKLLVDLETFLKSYPGEVAPAVELRHPDYFTAAGKTWLDLMQRLGMPAVITDTAGRRDCVHMRLTTPIAFIRFTGNNLHPSDFARLDAWADRLAAWLKMGLQEIYFFVHTSPKLNCPELSNYFTDALMKRTGLSLKKWAPPAAATDLLVATPAAKAKPTKKPEAMVKAPSKKDKPKTAAELKPAPASKASAKNKQTAKSSKPARPIKAKRK